MWSSWWDCMRWWESAWSSNAWDGPFWVMFLLLLWPVVVIGAVIFVMVMLLNRDGTTPARRGDPTTLTPFEILRERFARGEINQAEYEEKRRVILRS